MKFTYPLVKGKFLKRYKRFFVDVEKEDGDIITCHCPNTGSMKGLLEEGFGAYASPANDPKRKLQYTLEMIETPTSLVGVNTSRPNSLVEEAVAGDQIPELLGYDRISREVKYGKEGKSRIDLLLKSDEDMPDCYVEVKNVTLKEGDAALFPDAVTSRGLKHLEELQDVVQQGFRAVMFFVIQRTDCNFFAPAASIDPAYTAKLKEVSENGVEVLAYTCSLNEERIVLNERMEIRL